MRRWSPSGWAAYSLRAAGVDNELVGRTLEKACREFPPEDLEGIVFSFANDREKAVAMLPWLSLACARFKQFSSLRDDREIAPKAHTDLVKEARKAAMALNSALYELERAAGRIEDASEKKARFEHAWNLIEGGFHEESGVSITEFQILLMELLSPLESADVYVDRPAHLGERAEPLHAPRSASIPGLRNSIGLLAWFWTELTGKPPSTDKRSKDPCAFTPFVRFVRDVIAHCGRLQSVPSAKQVRTAMERLRPLPK